MLISIVTPVFNEQETVANFCLAIDSTLRPLNEDYEIVFVDDGSRDATLLALADLKHSYPRIRILKLSRNFGKEAALSAGIDYARGDVVIPMDVDLQDPPELLPQMLAKHREGFEVVLAKRRTRGNDTFLKRSTANAFYWLINHMAETHVSKNVGDFRLISRKVVDCIKQLQETQRFMKGILSWPGYATCTLEFDRPERSAGSTNFNFIKLWRLALEGITSFSTAPLKIWTYIGLATSLLALIYGIYTISKTLITGIDVPGYASLLVAVLFLGGIQLISLGILGEYVGRVYMEIKKRPVYLVDSEL